MTPELRFDTAAPLVSVVIAALNARAWIEETLHSVAAQAYPSTSLEVLLVDDGSSDGTSGIAGRCLEAAGLRHRILRHDAPKGPSAARNRGWQAAEGTWIQFLDSDDLLEPDKIARQVHAVQLSSPDVAAVFSSWGWLVQTPDGAWVKTAPQHPALGDVPLQDILTAANFMPHASMLFARAWVARVGGYVESFQLIEDVDLLMRLIMRGGIVRHTPGPPVFWYRHRSDSLSQSDRVAFARGCLRNFQAAEQHWSETQQLAPDRVRFLTEQYFGLARFFAEHDRVTFETLLQSIYALNPDFVPTRPLALQGASRLVGYRRAEQLAVGYRRLKRLLRSQRALR